MITASQLNRVLACPASEAFPHVHSAGDYADGGIAIHRYIEEAKFGVSDALARVPEQHRERCRGIDLAKLPAEARVAATEVALVLDLSSSSSKAREIGRGSHVTYGTLGRHEIGGRADLLALLDEAVYIGDIKTGRYRGAPDEDAQLLFLALAACHAYNRERAIVEHIYIDEPGDMLTVRATVDWFALLDFEQRLKALQAQVAKLRRARNKTQLTVYEGSWCRYCPAYVHCPAKRQLAIDLGTGMLARDAGALTREQAGAIYLRCREAQTVIARIRSAIEEMTAAGPLGLPDGRRLELVQRPGNEAVDGAAAMPVLIELLGRDLAQEIAQYHVTKSQLHRVLKEHALADREGDVLRLLRESGAITRTPSSRVEIINTGDEPKVDDDRR